jgi:hypothetical protein
MRLAAVLFVALALPAAAAAGLPRGRPVPPAQAAAIAKRAGPLALLPKRMVLGFRYQSWSSRPGLLTVRFVHAGGWTIVYTARPFRGSCASGAEKSFQLDGNKAWWAPSAAGQQGWRCIGAVKVTAFTTRPPTRFADSALGQVVAAAGRY